MRIKDVEYVIRTGAFYLSNALQEYWPAVGNNEIAERNITIHLSRSLAESNFFCYAETPSGHATDNRIDLLALNPVNNVLLAVECKRLFSVERLQEILDDIKKLDNYEPFTKDLMFGVKQRYNIIIATTWNQKYAEWWSTSNGVNPTSNIIWDDISNNSLIKNAKWGSFVVTGFQDDKEKNGNFHYLLYCIIPVTTVK